ncbi:catalase, partial [Acinetobacter baumannii]|nr:catalase [Acinetobacter baumannii]
MSKLIQPISFKALFIFTPLLFVSIGCSEALYSQTIPSVKSSSENIDYPEIDTALGEKLQPNEEVIAHQITQVIEKSIREQYT